MKKSILVLLTIAALTGCQTFSAANQKLKSTVDHYCSLPAFEREINRDLINSQIAPNQIALTCAETK